MVEESGLGKTQRDWEDDDEEETNGKNGKKKNGKEELVVEIDFEDIHERQVQVTNQIGSESSVLISKDGETFYFSSRADKSNYMSVKWDGSEPKTILSGRGIYGVSWDKDKKNIYYVERGRLGKLTPSSKKTESLNFEAKMTLDYAAERKQIFHDGWRALEAGFYDPNFHGQDFKALRDLYEERALAASTIQDFRDMYNEMLGQLNASHMGIRGGANPEQTQRESTGLIGIEIIPDPNGVKITRVVPGTPADRDRSKLAVGEVISAVNTEALGSGDNFYSRFLGTANERVLLNVTGTDGQSREVIIRPDASLSTELYEAWVKERQRLTEEYSNGQLGYIHIRSMGISSYERFERELMATGYGKKGILIDVRFNGGGSTTDLMMALLNVNQHAYTVPRGAVSSLEKENKKFADTYPFNERLPFPPLMKPSIALCNANSYSNAEIFSHAYKNLGIGTLVGYPTFGAVISTGAHSLIDGSYVRMPFRAWYVKATGENMEHGPAVPDIIVDNQPDGKAKGQDLQLKRAVEELLKQVNGK